MPCARYEVRRCLIKRAVGESRKDKSELDLPYFSRDRSLADFLSVTRSGQARNRDFFARIRHSSHAYHFYVIIDA